MEDVPEDVAWRKEKLLHLLRWHKWSEGQEQLQEMLLSLHQLFSLENGEREETTDN